MEIQAKESSVQGMCIYPEESVKPQVVFDPIGWCNCNTTICFPPFFKNPYHNDLPSGSINLVINQLGPLHIPDVLNPRVLF